MHLVLCDRRDTSALWAFLGLQRKGLSTVALVTDADLAGARRWHHRLGADGVSFSIELRDGRHLSHVDIDAVLNRLLVAPPPPAGVSPADLDYAVQELQALYASWLSALGDRVVNRPVPHGLAGPLLVPFEWLALGAAAGLDTVPLTISTRARTASSPDGAGRTVIVVDGEAVTDAPSSVAAGVARLAALVECRVLGADFVVTGDSWRLRTATPVPDLTLGGEQLLHRLGSLLSTAGAPA